jgi:redox-sensitive bicupin YhaK (pirin superfamily)
MPYEFHPNHERGHVKHGWLTSSHSFSFARYYNPNRMHFGALLVLNEDAIAGGMGFGAHSHDNMEIVTIPLAGALKHQDSMGNSATISSGEVQIMSAGTGITHSEVNASTDEDVHLLQIWIIPQEKNILPRYEQLALPHPFPRNTFLTLISPTPEKHQLRIFQECWFSLAEFDKAQSFTFIPHKKEHGIFLFVIKGEMKIQHQELRRGDAIAIWNEEKIEGKIEKPCHLLAIEVPMISPKYDD